ncbi:hypothetical protein AYI69_g4510 [Smittium culicis]|uniref:PIN domain-containing protein n=1 Tax=Smittium culicis TaxID=133412 RepID=A0A1R1YD38_9FUNG|nr:hypothetical protein AYI69_g4510 [Smittium culicis]
MSNSNHESLSVSSTTETINIDLVRIPSIANNNFKNLDSTILAKGLLHIPEIKAAPRKSQSDSVPAGIKNPNISSQSGVIKLKSLKYKKTPKLSNKIASHKTPKSSIITKSNPKFPDSDNTHLPSFDKSMYNVSAKSKSDLKSNSQTSSTSKSKIKAKTAQENHKNSNLPPKKPSLKSNKDNSLSQKSKKESLPNVASTVPSIQTENNIENSFPIAKIKGISIIKMPSLSGGNAGSPKSKPAGIPQRLSSDTFKKSTTAILSADSNTLSKGFANTSRKSIAKPHQNSTNPSKQSRKSSKKVINTPNTPNVDTNTVSQISTVDSNFEAKISKAKASLLSLSEHIKEFKSLNALCFFKKLQYDIITINEDDIFNQILAALYSNINYKSNFIFINDNQPLEQYDRLIGLDHPTISKSILWFEALSLGTRIQETCLVYISRKLDSRSIDHSTIISLWRYSIYPIIETFRLMINPNFPQNKNTYEYTSNNNTEPSILENNVKLIIEKFYNSIIFKTFESFLQVSILSYQNILLATESLQFSIDPTTSASEHKFKTNVQFIRHKSSEALGDMFRYLYIHTPNIPARNTSLISSFPVPNNDLFVSKAIENVYSSFKWYIYGLHIGAPNGILYHRLSILGWQTKSVFRSVFYSMLSISSTFSFAVSRESLLIYLEKSQQMATSAFSPINKSNDQNAHLLQSPNKSNPNQANRKQILMKNSKEIYKSINSINSTQLVGKKKFNLLRFFSMLLKDNLIYNLSTCSNCIEPYSKIFSISNTLNNTYVDNPNHKHTREFFLLLRNSLLLSHLKLHHMTFSKVNIDEFDVWLKDYYLPLLNTYIKNIEPKHHQFSDISECLCNTFKELNPQEIISSVQIIRSADYNLALFDKVLHISFIDGDLLALSDLTSLYSYGRAINKSDETSYEIQCTSSLIKDTFSSMINHLYASVQKAILESTEKSETDSHASEDTSEPTSIPNVPSISTRYILIILLYCCYPKKISASGKIDHHLCKNSTPSMSDDSNKFVDDNLNNSPATDATYSYLTSILSEDVFINKLVNFLNNISELFKTLHINISSLSKFDEAELFDLLKIPTLNFKYINTTAIFSGKSSIIDQNSFTNIDDITDKSKNSNFSNFLDSLEIYYIWNLAITLSYSKTFPMDFDPEKKIFYMLDTSKSLKTIYSPKSSNPFEEVSSNLYTDTYRKSCNTTSGESDTLSDYDSDESYDLDSLHLSNIDKLKQEYLVLQNQLSNASKRHRVKKASRKLNSSKLKNRNPVKKSAFNDVKESKNCELSSGYLSLDAASLKNAGFVFDTNCYIESLDKIKDFLNTSGFDLYVPLAVLMELDGLKSNPNPLGPISSNAVSFIEKSYENSNLFLSNNNKKSKNGTVFDSECILPSDNLKYKEPGKLRIVTMKGNNLTNLKFRTESYYTCDENDTIQRKTRCIDDVIVSTCQKIIFPASNYNTTLNASTMQEKNNTLLQSPVRNSRDLEPSRSNTVVLVTSDINMRIKATILGITTVSFKTLNKWFNDYKKKNYL